MEAVFTYIYLFTVCIRTGGREQKTEGLLKEHTQIGGSVMIHSFEGLNYYYYIFFVIL